MRLRDNEAALGYFGDRTTLETICQLCHGLSISAEFRMGGTVIIELSENGSSLSPFQRAFL